MNTLALIMAVALVESQGNPAAYNPKEGAVGLLQIRQGAVTDLNRHYKTDYKLTDFYAPILSIWAFQAYGKMYGAKTPEEYCRIWNGGPKGMKKLSTEKYWQKVLSKINENNP